MVLVLQQQCVGCSGAGAINQPAVKAVKLVHVHRCLQPVTDIGIWILFLSDSERLHDILSCYWYCHSHVLTCYISWNCSLKLSVSSMCRVPTTPSTTSVAPITCPLSQGYSQFTVGFVKYENLGDVTSTCSRCDTPTNNIQDFCDIVFDICVSPLGTRYKLVTTAAITFTMINFD